MLKSTRPLVIWDMRRLMFGMSDQKLILFLLLNSPTGLPPVVSTTNWLPNQPTFGVRSAGWWVVKGHEVKSSLPHERHQPTEDDLVATWLVIGGVIRWLHYDNVAVIEWLPNLGASLLPSRQAVSRIGHSKILSPHSFTLSEHNSRNSKVPFEGSIQNLADVYGGHIRYWAAGDRCRREWDP